MLTITIQQLKTENSAYAKELLKKFKDAHSALLKLYLIILVDEIISGSNSELNDGIQIFDTEL